MAGYLRKDEDEDRGECKGKRKRKADTRSTWKRRRKISWIGPGRN